MKKKNNIITIDFNVWCTQAQRSELSGEKLTTISTKVKRTLAGNTSPKTYMDTLRIEQLNLTLVKRP